MSVQRTAKAGEREEERESCWTVVTWHTGKMSTENQNGSAGTQSNGIKSSIGVTSTRTASNNSSFLYSSTSMLNREKPRQVPPPTLPKYTSSFNAGSNGSGTTERLNRDREVGGSYRLASLDRLALRQRILDGEKANGDTTSVSKIISILTASFGPFFSSKFTCETDFTV